MWSLARCWAGNAHVAEHLVLALVHQGGELRPACGRTGRRPGARSAAPSAMGCRKAWRRRPRPCACSALGTWASALRIQCTRGLLKKLGLDGAGFDAGVTSLSQRTGSLSAGREEPGRRPGGCDPRPEGEKERQRAAASRFRLTAAAVRKAWMRMFWSPRRTARASPCQVLASPWKPSDRQRWRW